MPRVFCFLLTLIFLAGCAAPAPTLTPAHYRAPCIAYNMPTCNGLTTSV